LLIVYIDQPQESMKEIAQHYTTEVPGLSPATHKPLEIQLEKPGSEDLAQNREDDNQIEKELKSQTSELILDNDSIQVFFKTNQQGFNWTRDNLLRLRADTSNGSLSDEQLDDIKSD